MKMSFLRRPGGRLCSLLLLATPVWNAHAADLPMERISCSIAAAVKYQIPVNAMLAVAEQEGGRPGLRMRNSNGTFDVGSMQMNTAYLRELRRFGIEERDVAGPGCYPYDLAAWRLRKHLTEDRGDIWTRIANYHSRTPEHNARYRASLIRRATRWSEWLKARYPTYVRY